MLDLVMRLKFNPSECDDCCDLTSSSFEPSCVCCFLLQVASSNEQIAQQDTGNTPRNSQQRNGTRSMSLNGMPRGFMTSSTVKVSRSHDSVKCLKLKCDQASQGFLVQIVLFWWDFLSYDAKFYPLLRQFIGF
jgi:hypothetical protein